MMAEQRGFRVTEYFRARLGEETRRSERYERPFGVLFIACRGAHARDVFNSLRPFLRCTDLVEVIRGPGEPDSGGEPPDHVAVILPETDREQALHTLDRLKEKLPGLDAYETGLAVFPEDGTHPNDLLAKAATAAGEQFHP